MEAMTVGLIIVVVSVVVAVLIATNGGKSYNKDQTDRERVMNYIEEINKKERLRQEEIDLRKKEWQESQPEGWRLKPIIIKDNNEYYEVWNKYSLLLGCDGIYYLEEMKSENLFTHGFASMSYECIFTKKEAQEAIEGYIKQENDKALNLKKEKEFLQQPPIEYTPHSTIKDKQEWK